jgi:hypothetical protein
MLSKVGNVLAKGLKTAGHVLVGSTLYGLQTAVTNYHPTDPMVALLWGSIGVSVWSAASAAILRWAQFDPSKLGK